MLHVLFHCHTLYSKDCLLAPRDLLRRCVLAGIDRVVVTEHNGIEGALASLALNQERVIVGEKIMTAQGELLAAFLKSRVGAHLSPRETLARLLDQGAFVSVARPFDRRRRGGGKEQDLMEIVPFVQAIEVYNSRWMRPRATGPRSNLASATIWPALRARTHVLPRRWVAPCSFCRDSKVPTGCRQSFERGGRKLGGHRRAFIFLRATPARGRGGALLLTR